MVQQMTKEQARQRGFTLIELFIGVVQTGTLVLASSRLEIDIGLQSSGTTP
jgi:Tfp pilus assembly protein PilW